MSSSSNLSKITSDKVKKYYKYFNEYKYARRFIDQMKTYPNANLWIDQQKEPTLLFFQMPWLNILAGDHTSPKVHTILDKVETALVFYPNPEWKKVIQERFDNILEEYSDFHIQERLSINYLLSYTKSSTSNINNHLNQNKGIMKLFL